MDHMGICEMLSENMPFLCITEKLMATGALSF